MLAVRDKSPGKLTAAKDKVVVSLGDKTEIPLKFTRSLPDFKANLQVAPVPDELPAGMAFAQSQLRPGQGRFERRCHRRHRTRCRGPTISSSAASPTAVECGDRERRNSQHDFGFDAGAVDGAAETGRHAVGR